MLPTTLRTMAAYSRLIRFVPQGASASSAPAIGEPVNKDQDVGLASYNGERIEVELFSGSSVLSPGERSGKTVLVDRVLSPLAQREVGTIRCIGLNYVDHAKEANLPIPDLPTLFYKPATALGDPFPAPTVIPRHVVADNAADYEAELAVVIGKDAKNVTEAEAMDYVLGYTAADDVSSRVAQFATSQWGYSKSFDGACPIGPALIPASSVKDISDLKIQASLNGDVVQESGMGNLIFSVPKIVSFLSQGTTLPAGTVIITGTPAGVGWTANPRRTLKTGDEFRVGLSHGVGTLINRIEEEK